MRLQVLGMAALAAALAGEALAQGSPFDPPASAPATPKAKSKSKSTKAKSATPPPAAESAPAKAAAPPPASAAPAAAAGAAAGAAGAAAAGHAGVAMPPPPNNNCQNTVAFERWFPEFRKDALAQGVKPATFESAVGGMTPDHGIIARDRRQGFFSQTFLDFSAKLATSNRLQNGQRTIQRHNAIFNQAEKEYGVPSAVLAAFWALESDFGVGMGNLPVLRSLLTLAWDCRRGEMFRGELIAAMKIIDRGDLRPSEMIGSWAGELGQTQFLPSHYFNYAIDYDGDGRRDLMRSIPDIIGSSANFVAQLGWRRGEPWLQEVKVPASMPWDQADLAIQHPRSQWAKWGVTLPDGRPIQGDGQPASLLLLMGRNGPAFLAYPNFQVYLKWNQSLNYATTAAYLATRIAGAPTMSRGNAPVTPLDAAQIKELQQILARMGHNVGEADGKLGAATRTAVKAAQLKLGLPADSYPSPELLEKLRRPR